MSFNDFDWADDDSIAVRSQPATAVYTNKLKQVVIRQEADWNEESDRFVYVSRENALTIVRQILVAAGYEDARLYGYDAGGGCYDIDWPEPLIDSDEAEASEAEPEHVPVKQRRARVAEVLRADPSRSNRSIASHCGVSDKTVAAVRAGLSAEIPNNSAENAHEGADFRGQEALQLVAAE